ncbi:glycosyltransferase [Peribacillus butanolivorans]|uniref:glycosyltransferase n=1 Tax=Peribacillus butanolivorans TaxID=421767 RepID=UPI003672F693
MKKRILFVAGTLRVGGIERSLINLLNSIDYKDYEVHLFLYSNTGEYLKDLPENVVLVNKSAFFKCIGMTLKEAKETGKISIILLRVVAALLCKIFGSKYVFNVFFKFLPKYKNYDLAISFSNNVSPRTLYFGYNQFVLSRVIAKKKIAWIHSDYIKAGLNNKINNHEYSKFDAIINVSLAGKNTFDQVRPELKSKSFVIYNTFNIQDIIEQSRRDKPYYNIKKLKLVTVGRIDENKSIDRIINITEKLKRDGFIFIWYIVGEGNLRPELEKKTSELGLNENIVFLGNQTNPYPFIKNADILVLASKYEGMPMVITESLILKTPVVVTRYNAAEEQVIDGFNGLIAENSEEGLYIALKKILENNNILKEMEKNIINTEISNKVALNQFGKIIKGEKVFEREK